MPEGKKAAVPAPKPVREEDLYSAKTHLHQPVPVQETATVSATTAQLADAPEGALPSEVRPEIVTWGKLCEAIKASGRSYNMEMIERHMTLPTLPTRGVPPQRRAVYLPSAGCGTAGAGPWYGLREHCCGPAARCGGGHSPTTLDDLKAAFGEEVAPAGGRRDQADQDPVL